MEHKSSISKSNSPEIDFSADEYIKSSEIKREPKDYDNFSNEGYHNELENIKRVQFMKVECVELDKTTEEDADGDFSTKNVFNALEIEGMIDKSFDVDSCDVKILSKKTSHIDKLEFIGHNVDNTYESDETDDSMDNVYNTNHKVG